MNNKKIIISIVLFFLVIFAIFIINRQKKNVISSPSAPTPTPIPSPSAPIPIPPITPLPIPTPFPIMPTPPPIQPPNIPLPTPVLPPAPIQPTPPKPPIVTPTPPIPAPPTPVPYPVIPRNVTPIPTPSPPVPVPQTKCGLNVQGFSYTEPSAYIVNGRVSGLGRCPCMIRLGVNTLCGGALITPTWILSAAHCDIPIGSDAIAGFFDFDDPYKETSRQPRKIIRIIKHPEYGKGPTNHYNDIMLIEVASPYTLNQYVYPICLPQENWSLKNFDMTVYGWGVTVVNNDPSKVGRKLQELTVREADTCRHHIDPRVQLCCGNPTGTTCWGDSGGPLVLKYNNIQYVVGLVSWGAFPNCDYQTVYTRVSAYIRFIKSHINI